MANDNEPTNVLEAVKDHVSQGHTVGGDRVSFLVDTFGVQQVLAKLIDEVSRGETSSGIRVPILVDANGTVLVDAGLPTNNSGELRVTTEKLDDIIDVLERIQQHLGQINNGNNLNPGERFE